MRILHVTREHLSDRRYGLGKSLTPIIEALEHRGHVVRYFCQEDLSPIQRSRRDTHIHRLLGWPGVQGRQNRAQLISAMGERLHMGWQAAKVTKRENYTHVHLHDPWMAWGYLLAAHYYRLKGIRWGITEHGFGCYSLATHDDGLRQGNRVQRLLRRLEAKILAKAHWVVAPTASALASLVRDLALPEQPAHWHCIPHARPTPTRLDKSLARTKLGWNSEHLVVIAVGRIVPLKHFERILSACISLSDQFPALHLHILGDGPHEHLKRQATQARFEHRLHITVTDNVADYLAASDIYVSMSATESFGLANLEALCAGLPALCSAVGGVSEVVGDGAWLIPNNEEILSRCLGNLLHDPNLRQALQERAVRRAAAWPDAEVICDAYLAIYET